MTTDENQNEATEGRSDSEALLAARRVPKPSGWKGKKTDKWYTRDSAYGVRYMCPYCGKNNLGIVWGEAAKDMHWGSCPTLSS